MTTAPRGEHPGTIEGSQATGRPTPPQVRTQPPGYYRVPLGDFVVTAISDGTVPLPLDKLLLGISPEDLAALLAREHATTPTEASINAFLVHAGDRLVLVDTGAGMVFGPEAGGRLVPNLRAAGYAPEDVDAVLLTHIHGDHSAGLSAGGRRVFPNAEVHVHRAEVDFWLDAGEAARARPDHRHAFDEAAEMMTPYLDAGRVRTFEGAGEIVPGFTTRPSPGHTPGHTCFDVRSRGARIVFAGDVVHSPEVQLPRPDVTIAFDIDPAASARARAAFLRDASAEGFLVGASHTSFPGLGRFRSADPGYAWIPAAYHLEPVDHASP